MARFLYLAFLVCTVTVATGNAQISVSISSTFSAVAYNNELVLAADDVETFELPHPPLKDKYVVIAGIHSGALDLVAFDQINVERNTPNPIFLMDKTLNGTSAIPLPASTSGQGIVVSFINNSRFPRNLRYVVFRFGTRPLSVRTQLQKVVEIPLKALAKFYRMPKFDVVVAPCGTVNAYSDPNITLCSELLADLHEKDMTKALYPILYHELAHTLLRLWGLPGYDNEDIADEFAAAMLARVFPTHIETLIKYLETQDSTVEALAQLTERSKHSLSIDRARNMRNAMRNIAELEARWGKLLKPFEVKPSAPPSDGQWQLLERQAGVPTYYQRVTFDDDIISIWLKKGRELGITHINVDCSNHKIRYVVAVQGSKLLPADTEWRTPGPKYGEWVYSEICSKFAR